MDEYWATRTGRWRKAMQAQAAPTLLERLYAVIRSDVRNGALPAGALLPTAERVAQELAVHATDVQEAYSRLVAEGVLGQRPNGMPFVPAAEGQDEQDIGDATQIRFESALLRAVREAAARGLSSTEATGMFKAAMMRMQEMERPRSDDDHDD
jgi:DNA-binding transcriptional regulator YhcF (GntR family)